MSCQFSWPRHVVPRHRPSHGKHGFSVIPFPASLPSTLLGLNPHMFLVIHTGQTTLHPTFPAQALLASLHTPFPHIFTGPSLPFLFPAALHSPLYYFDRNTRLQDRGNTHLYYRQPNFLPLESVSKCWPAESACGSCPWEKKHEGPSWCNAMHGHGFTKDCALVFAEG